VEKTAMRGKPDLNRASHLERKNGSLRQWCKRLTYAFSKKVEPAERPEKLSAALATVPRGSEVILLVEDEDTVRRLARTFLENRGYQVLEARHGGDGLALCRNHQGSIHLLLTDIAMPEMGGRELAEQAISLRPEMKVLFMSGYTDDTLISERIKVQGTPFLQKPFTLQDLGRCSPQ
jgi:two-component system, cell cycle sensor histidine kinase and response regulator CckA